jgi:hypothetical protein
VKRKAKYQHYQIFEVNPPDWCDDVVYEYKTPRGVAEILAKD